MQHYNVQQAQIEYNSELIALRNRGVVLTENQEAILFAKVLIMQQASFTGLAMFCSDNEFFVSRTPSGYDVVGYYVDLQRAKKPFSITVCKAGGLWYPSRRYVAADTKSGSGFILLWVLLSLGCTLMGILMYFLMSSAIGI